MIFAAPPILTGKHVLIVEDEHLIALMVEDFLVEMGCKPVGPFNTVDSALEAAKTRQIDLAVLDVNLAGEMVYPVAEALTERQIPFVFLSGYGDEAIPPGRPDWHVCAKPFRGKYLADMLVSVLSTEVH